MDQLRLALEAGGGLIRRMLDASLNGIYVHDLRAGVHTYINTQYTRLTGYSIEQLAAMDSEAFFSLFPAEDRVRLHDHEAELAQCPDGTRLEIEYQFLRSDGTWIWCLSSNAVLERDPDGSVRSIVGTFLDISGRKEAESSLVLSESRARRHLDEIALIYDSAPIGLCVLDTELRYVRINQRLAGLNGIPAAEHIGRTIHEVVPGIASAVEPLLRRVAETGEAAIDIEIHGETPAQPDVPRTWVGSFLPLREGSGLVSGISIVAKEVTEERKAQSRARTLATVVETSADFIGVASLEGQAIYLNRAGQALVGLEGESAVTATHVQDYLFPEDLPFVRETVLPTVMGEGRWRGDFRFRHFLTGEPIDVHWDVVRIDDPDTGQPARLATVTRDIRKEKAAGRALREADRRKDEFLTVLGHELRNPMAPIRNAVEVLHLLKSGADPRTDWALRVLDRQTTHLSRLLDDLLDVSRIVRGKLKLEPRPVALRDVIQQAVDGVGPLIQERRHRLHLHLPADDVLVNGDPVRLAQILLNLLLNAAYYTQEAGEIRLTTDTEGSEVIVRVRDNGPGIPPERLSDLFRPFYQGERAEGASAGGLGLGLTISRRLAEMHGGRLEANSAWPAPGSEFSLYLPRPKRSAPAIEPPASRGPDQAQDLRVLVVDDQVDVARSMALLLEVLGYRVETASTGAEALELAARFEPRVALVDIGLPDMDGLALARRLRAQYPEPGRLLLVAVTGYGHDEARQRSLESGFDEHLAKPVDRHTLQALLEGVVAAQEGQGA